MMAKGNKVKKGEAIKMKYFILALFLVTILVVACENIDISKLSDKDLERLSEKLIVCETPYIRHGSGCCLDQNTDRICDEDEKDIPKEEPIQDKFLGEKCVISIGSGMFCEEFNAVAGTGVTIRIKNILTDSIWVDSVALDTPVCTFSAADTEIAADGTTDFLLACAGLTSGTRIEGTLTITYDVGATAGAGFSKSTTGQLTTVVP